MCRRGLVLFGAIAIIIGCTRISVISGPRTLNAGDAATYVLSLGGSDAADGVTLYVVADVPDSWVLSSSSYTGTASGVPIGGSGTVVAEPYPDLLPAAGDGFQRLWIGDGPFDMTAADTGEMTLDFAVADVPDGEFVLRFWFVSSADPGSSVSRPAYVEINRESHEYRFLRALDQASGALEYNFAVATSGDGRSLVLGGILAPFVSVFDRVPLTGGLESNHQLSDPILDGLSDLTFEPGGSQVYAAYGVYQSMALFSARCFADGFETGNTGAWSVSVH